MNRPFSSDDSDFWQDIVVDGEGEVSRNGLWGWSRKLAEPNPGVCKGPSSTTVKSRQDEAAFHIGSQIEAGAAEAINNQICSVIKRDCCLVFFSVVNMHF